MPDPDPSGANYLDSLGQILTDRTNPDLANRLLGQLTGQNSSNGIQIPNATPQGPSTAPANTFNRKPSWASDIPDDPWNAPTIAQPTNPLMPQMPQGSKHTQIQPSGSQALALMQMLLPKNHKFIPVDHDPFNQG